MYQTKIDKFEECSQVIAFYKSVLTVLYPNEFYFILSPGAMIAYSGKVHGTSGPWGTSG